MNDVVVVDRGAREVVVFLSGDVGAELDERFDAAVDEVARLAELNALNHVVVDMHQVSSMSEAGITFLRALSERGRRTGFEVSFSTMSGPAHRAVEAAGWSFLEHSPPTAPPRA